MQLSLSNIPFDHPTIHLWSNISVPSSVFPTFCLLLFTLCFRHHISVDLFIRLSIPPGGAGRHNVSSCIIHKVKEGFHNVHFKFTLSQRRSLECMEQRELCVEGVNWGSVTVASRVRRTFSARPAGQKPFWAVLLRRSGAFEPTWRQRREG
ncbi:unnamed protein product [Protopolystoma xenopodis]|uniref:Uncharacterized protein n=1 Tax=Protopolystoma xenopodis TaxID=117903 RepID=A0A3S5ALK7_9PLAT|nr:unnamed protein product [Protopolystoma xenopodis]